MSKVLLSLSICLPLFLGACADSPNSSAPSGPDSTESPQAIVDGAPITAMALKYKGVGPLGVPCDLYIAVEDEGETDSDDHQHAEHFLMKFDYETADGHRPSAAEGQFQQVVDGDFLDIEPEVAGSVINLLAAEVMSDPDRKLKSIDEMYELTAHNQLEQAFQVEFHSDLDFHDYEEALQSVLADPQTFAVQKDTLDQIDSATLILLHNGDHPHTPVCKFNTDETGAVDVVETTFDFSHSHDDGNKNKDDKSTDPQAGDDHDHKGHNHGDKDGDHDDENEGERGDAHDGHDNDDEGDKHDHAGHGQH